MTRASDSEQMSLDMKGTMFKIIDLISSLFLLKEKMTRPSDSEQMFGYERHYVLEKDISFYLLIAVGNSNWWLSELHKTSRHYAFKLLLKNVKQ